MKTEPVLTDAGKQLLITGVTWVAAKYVPGLNLTTDQATAVSLAMLSVVTVVWGFITRKKVVSVATIEAKLKEEHPAAFAALMPEAKQ